VISYQEREKWHNACTIARGAFVYPTPIPASIQLPFGRMARWIIYLTPVTFGGIISSVAKGYIWYVLYAMVGFEVKVMRFAEYSRQGVVVGR
jgi:hypothetical protein